MFGITRHCRLAGLLVLAAVCGCSSPAATLELIAAARQGLTLERRGQEDVHEQVLALLQSQTRALDAAFDADVRLIASGQVSDSSGAAVAMTPEWVVSARKGYIAAREMVGEQIVSARAAHNVRLDNLAACDRTLELAEQLMLRQTAATEAVKQHLMNIHRRLIDGE